MLVVFLGLTLEILIMGKNIEQTKSLSKNGKFQKTVVAVKINSKN